MTTGLIIGRFMPPQAGHRLIVETALRLVDRLLILVSASDGDAIPIGQRIAWLAELFPAAFLRIAEPGIPIGMAADEPIDLLFSGDAGAASIADALGARLVLLDPRREAFGGRPPSLVDAAGRIVPHAPARARSICLHGPESTGKSTLAPLLARHFDTIYVPEYGRTYCEQYGLDLTMRDLVEIARTQSAMGQAALDLCSRRLILDTDPLMTAAWAEMLFGRHDPWFDRFDTPADLYLLLDIDLPWIDDGTRFFGGAESRQRFFDLSRAELERRGLAYAIIGGSPEQRFARSLDAIAEAGL